MVNRGPLGLLWRFWLAEAMLALMIAALLVVNILWGVPAAPFLAGLVIGRVSTSRLGLVGWKPGLFFYRLTRLVARFRSIRAGRVSVLFPPGLDGSVALDAIIRAAEEERDDLARRFGFRIRRRLRIVLFPDGRELSGAFGRPVRGLALVPANAVLLAAEAARREGLRHELAHLFAARWNLNPPPLFQEGLAVWLEGSARDAPATAGQWSDVADLLEDRHFFSNDQVDRCYGQAGIFTGFLIRRFGWDRYRAFYRKARRSGLPRAFAKHYGMPLEVAWLRCRDESLAMARLDRRLREDDLFRLRA